jgi:hypothetical protein
LLTNYKKQKEKGTKHMANIFKNPQLMTELQEQADLYLADQYILPYVTNTNLIQDKFATSATGGTIRVKNRPLPSPVSNQFSNIGSTVTASDVQESETLVTLDKWYPKRILTNAFEDVVSVSDFMAEIVAPAIDDVMAGIEADAIAGIVAGFSPTLTGTAGNNPSTLAHLSAAETAIFNNRGKTDNLVAIMNTTAYDSYAALDSNINSLYGGSGLANKSISAKSGVKQFYRSRFASLAAFDRGYITGTVLVQGGSQSGSTLAVDGYTAATGTTKKGTRITIAGVTGTYTLIADAVIAGNATTYQLDRTLASAPADNAAITFASAHTNNVVFDPRAVIAAIVPGKAGSNSSILGGNGPIRIRMSESGVKTDTGSSELLFDTFMGLNIKQFQFGAVVQG